MKKFKKFLTLLLALSVFMTFTIAVNVTAFAAGNGDGKQDDQDTATVSVTGIQKADGDTLTVYAYKFVDAEYNTSGLNKFFAVLQKNDDNGDPMTDSSGNKIMIPENLEKPTEAEIEQLQSRTGELGTPIEMDQAVQQDGTITCTADVKAGSYLVVVTGSSTRTYNPIIVSASYAKDATDLSGGTVDSTSNAELNGSTAYAKSSDITIDKNILKKDAYGNIVDANGAIVIDANGNIVNETLVPEKLKSNVSELGKTVSYEITGEIPSFTEKYTNPVYTITDTPDPALSLPSTITVKVGGTVIPATNDDGTVNYTFTPNTTDHNFTVAFSATYITSLRNKAASERAVVITFDSTLDKDKANVSFKPNDNTAKVTWGNDTDDTQDSDEVTTHTYSFGIDMDINGEGTKHTHEITKTGDKITGTTKTTVPLAGATFELRDTDGTVIDSNKTDDGGHVRLKGMGENKEYILVETQAPSGYTADSTQYTVKVKDVTYDANNKLSGYSIDIYKGTGNTKTLLSTFTYTIDADGNVTGINDGKDGVTYQVDGDNGKPSGKPGDVMDDTSVFINNPLIPGLPSTGGIGTYLFTIAGVALMVVAIALIIARRKRKA